jgi:hypothetical protein
VGNGKYSTVFCAEPVPDSPFYNPKLKKVAIKSVKKDTLEEGQL